MFADFPNLEILVMLLCQHNFLACMVYHKFFLWYPLAFLKFLEVVSIFIPAKNASILPTLKSLVECLVQLHCFTSLYYWHYIKSMHMFSC